MSVEDMRARTEAATEGPWHSEVIRDYAPVQETFIIPDIVRDRYGNNAVNVGSDKATADFIAHARTDIPRLLAALDAVDEELSTYMLPSKLDDPTGEIGAAMEALELRIRVAISKALGDL